MTTATGRPLRVDAARNADRILRAARHTYAEWGPDAPIDMIAARAVWPNLPEADKAYYSDALVAPSQRP
jgi:hypothetical protein